MLLESWEPYGALVFGLGGVAMGILFRLGHLRTMARWYHKRHLPFYVRNLPFTTIPYGLMFLAAFSAFALADGGNSLQAMSPSAPYSLCSSGSASPSGRPSF